MEKTIEILSLEHFIHHVLCLSEKLNSPDFVWYRGVSNACHSLTPSLYREPFNSLLHQELPVLEPKDAPTPDHPTTLSEGGRKNIYRMEQSMDARFMTQSESFLRKKQIESTPMNRYLLKQHYSGKTRLLDWTESPLLALFFALNDEQSTETKNDAKISALLPLRLNNFSITRLLQFERPELEKKLQLKSEKVFQLNVLPTIPKEFVKKPLLNKEDIISLDALFGKYYHLRFSKDEKMYPFAFLPNYLDERMTAQKSCFTFFGNIITLKESLSEQERLSEEEKFLFSMIIPSICRDRILNELKTMGITLFSIYPDLDGLSKSINDKHLSEIIENKKSQESWNLIESSFPAGGNLTNP